MTNGMNITKLAGRAVRCAAFALLLAMAGFVSQAQAQGTGTTGTTSASNTAGFSDCPGPLGESVERSLRQGGQAGIAYGLYQGDEYNRQAVLNQAQNPRGAFNFKTSFCMQDLLLAFDMMNGLMAAKSRIAWAISQAIAYFANQVCSVAKDAVMTLVNNAMDLICIPLPDLSVGMLSLPDIKRKSCNGYAPLRDMMTVTMVPGLDYSSLVPPDLLTAPLSRWIQKNNIGSFNYSVRQAIETGDGRY